MLEVCSSRSSEGGRCTSTLPFPSTSAPTTLVLIPGSAFALASASLNPGASFGSQIVLQWWVDEGWMVKRIQIDAADIIEPSITVVEFVSTDRTTIPFNLLQSLHSSSSFSYWIEAPHHRLSSLADNTDRSPSLLSGLSTSREVLLSLDYRPHLGCNRRWLMPRLVRAVGSDR
ncbi:hypothetical protein NEOLEDRAFT_1131887 [Neolentinus lepideus HHB14362 ss-1]|uniref:Uncharacterized protein n=1 Tax=Neolentinus lepideus HHB14362 ss-1 TaxID=1314782 RepID=A0A165TL22_9AGAM|nr:hypothetical protein NEOLEDRAFT_1131887 [Neolentinus lepideus HHB14362 ss-1]